MSLDISQISIGDTVIIKEGSRAWKAGLSRGVVTGFRVRRQKSTVEVKSGEVRWVHLEEIGAVIGRPSDDYDETMERIMITQVVKMDQLEKRVLELEQVVDRLTGKEELQ
jgi:hypothetical protein